MILHSLFFKDGEQAHYLDNDRGSHIFCNYGESFRFDAEIEEAYLKISNMTYNQWKGRWGK